MFKFSPQELPCEIKDLISDIDNLMQEENKIETKIKILQFILNTENACNFFTNEDFKNQIELLSDNLQQIGLYSANLKARINYLTKN